MYPLFEQDLPKWINDPENWLRRLQYAIRKGLVFRLREGPDKVEKWRPGMMKKDGSTWIWEEKSIEELREYDIHFPHVRCIFSSNVPAWGLSIYLRPLLMIKSESV